jgi:hypothetical protein
MRTVLNTPDHLVIEDRPWFIAGTLWAAGLVAGFAASTGQMQTEGETLLLGALGLAIIAVTWRFVPYQRLTFDRATGKFTRRIARVTGVTTDTLYLRDIRRAAAQSDWGEAGRLERLVLLTRDSTVPLEFGFVGVPRARLIDTINSWLSHPA